MGLIREYAVGEGFLDGADVAVHGGGVVGEEGFDDFQMFRDVVAAAVIVP